MTIYADKPTFQVLGLETLRPSTSLRSNDCPICTEPLEEHIIHTSRRAQQDIHTIVRIIDCGHIYGAECLSAWLDTGHTCPMCKRMLFEARGDEITQEDVEALMDMFGVFLGEERVLVSIARVTKRIEVRGERQLRDEDVVLGRKRSEEIGFEMDEEDFMDEEDEEGALYCEGEEDEDEEGEMFFSGVDEDEDEE